MVSTRSSRKSNQSQLVASSLTRFSDPEKTGLFRLILSKDVWPTTLANFN